MIKLKDLIDTDDVAGVLMVYMCQNILLCKRNMGTKYWSVPKGHIIEGEEPVDGALRELEEETRIKLWNKLECVHEGKNKKKGKFHLFRCDINEPLVPILNHEHSTWKYF